MGKRARLPSAQMTAKQGQYKRRRQSKNGKTVDIEKDPELDMEFNGTITDQVEEESVNPSAKSSIWDRFDITKITNAEFKLGFVEPKMHGESPLIDIEIKDISSEIAYWRFAVVCHVLGPHPLFEVLKDFIQRIWSKLGINKISMLKNGIIIIRFDTEAGKQKVLQGGIYHFDNKPFIVKAWSPEMEFTRDELHTVPI
ncbi:hypothetical protein BC332_22941 [Capsicum chinense]|nr:hypothetical protein BC332_22941 [Capsicum chinense]